MAVRNIRSYTYTKGTVPFVYMEPLSRFATVPLLSLSTSRQSPVPDVIIDLTERFVHRGERFTLHQQRDSHTCPYCPQDPVPLALSLDFTPLHTIILFNIQISRDWRDCDYIYVRSQCLSNFPCTVLIHHVSRLHKVYNYNDCCYHYNLTRFFLPQRNRFP